MNTRLIRALRATSVFAVLLLGLLYTDLMQAAGNDAYYYLYAADTLRAGQGMLTWPDAPAEAVAVIGAGPYLTTWPPLYPLLLSLFPATWLGAQVVNLSAFLLSAWLAWRLLILYVPHRGLRWGGLLAVLISPPFQSAYTIPLTESLFITLTLAWVVLLPSVRHSVVPLALGAWCVYQSGLSLGGRRTARLATILFVFSPLAIEASYTAWAQNVLVPFYAMFMYLILRWSGHCHWRYGAAALVIATFTWMIHFSALMLFGIWGIVLLATRPPGWAHSFLWGVAISIVLVAPYLIFELSRDFVDVRAMLTNERLLVVPPGIPGVGGDMVKMPSWLGWTLGQFGAGFLFSWAQRVPILTGLPLWLATWLVGVGLAALTVFSAVKAVGSRSQPWQIVALGLLFCVAVFVVMGKHAGSYHYALVSWTCLLVAALVSRWRVRTLVNTGLIAMVGLFIFDSAQAVQLGHSGVQHTWFQNLYRDERAVVEYIAADCQCREVAITYDVARPSVDAWVIAYGRIEPLYFDGMEIDYLMRQTGLSITPTGQSYAVVRPQHWQSHADLPGSPRALTRFYVYAEDESMPRIGDT